MSSSANVESNHSGGSGYRTFLGTLLLLLGGGVTVFVFKEILGIYQNVQANVRVKVMGEYFRDTTLFSFAEQPLAVSEHGAALLGITLFILLALVAGSLSIRLMSAGIDLLTRSHEKKVPDPKPSPRYTG
mgnify:CR=1 FL=1